MSPGSIIFMVCFIKANLEAPFPMTGGGRIRKLVKAVLALLLLGVRGARV